VTEWRVTRKRRLWSSREWRGMARRRHHVGSLLAAGISHVK
jgi:hypothetical protein